MTTINRRRFLHLVGMGGAGAALAPLASWWPSPARASGAGPPTETEAASGPPSVAVVHGPSPAVITTAAVAALGGMGRFVSRGDVVVVKPNIGWDRKPEQAATTNPEVVAAVVRLAVEAGAAKVLVLDNTCNDARRCYQRSGIAEAAREAGAQVKHVEDRRSVEASIGGELLGEWPVFREFLEADKIINIPIAKHHSLSRLTLGMKNWIGAVGGRRSALHQEINRSIVDLAAFFKPALTVLDAVRVLTRNGPQGGNLGDVERLDTVAAGADMVAVEALGATLMGLGPRELPSVGLAEERGLGSAALEEMSLVRLEKP